MLEASRPFYEAPSLGRGEMCLVISYAIYVTKENSTG